MRYVLALLAAVNAWGVMPASSEECEPGLSLASLDNTYTVGSPTPWDRPNSVWSRTRRQHLSKKGNSNLQKRLRLLRKIARIGSGPWSWTASLPQGGCLIRFPIRMQSAHRHTQPPLNPVLLEALVNPARTSSGR